MTRIRCRASAPDNQGSAVGSPMLPRRAMFNLRPSHARAQRAVQPLMRTLEMWNRHLSGPSPSMSPP